MENKIIVSSSPHLHDRSSVKYVMWNVVIALLPALIAGIIHFGYKALTITIYSAVAAVVTEALIQKFRKKEITVNDGSAVLTGMLVAFNIHADSPWWLGVVGSIFAISIGKHVFGGLGFNIVNPALLGRAFLLASWPTLVTSGWVPSNLGNTSGLNIQNLPAQAQQLVTSATPLGVAKMMRNADIVNTIGVDNAHNVFSHLTDYSTLMNLFWGNIGGCIGEVSAFALLIGALYLLMLHIIEWRIPVFYIGTVFVLTYIFGGLDGIFSATIALPLFHILAGGLFLGAFFMATDMVTSPVTKKGRIIFGIGAGIICVVIRLIGGYPEGVSYSILIMNLFVPLIDRYTMPRAFGEVKA
ncbi:MAG TPA: RnfABCDGE type electron transport complex subunit D [Candidatus Cloacimonadota bacterium]|jgi:electron transport complex protein RnfD|nr:RnfABCDGE type electron transport complex subunit D [Candidatus Cloacimonadota bacterium]HPM01846.1 RnfABCDGE type electron transport complex subunit D [Candidatus Cloacimonadota bacterium]